MRTRDIYRFWFSKTKDHRYLRPKRWTEIEQVIERYKVKSVLEFGAGVSTLLFRNLKLDRHETYETDEKFVQFMNNLSGIAHVKLWNNDSLDLNGRKFDLALVDGINPRKPQLALALKHAKLVAVDDYIGGNIRRLETDMSPYKRVDSGKTITAIFKVS